jgi:hypothetical protein
MLTVIGPIGFIAIVIGLPLWVLVVSILLWRRGEPVVLVRQASNPAPPS